MKPSKITKENYWITNVELWNSDGVIPGCSVHVVAGQVKEISRSGGPKSEAAHVLDGRGKVLLPAGVDPQVHTRVPGQLEKETPESVLDAAISGGVACLLTMPNTKPVIDSVSSFELASRELADTGKTVNVECLISVAITEGQKGQKAVDFDALAGLGASAYTDDGVGVVSDDIMRQSFLASSRTGLPVLQHAEVPGHGAVLAAGPIQESLGIKAYPRSAEVDMVKRDLKLLADYPGAKYHVLHISCRETIDLVSQAKAKGLQATCEVTPHHLMLCSADIIDKHTSFKMNPPLRDGADRDALQRRLATGEIDFVSTDHAPHENEIKGDNFKTAAFGTLGLETSLRVLLDLQRRGVLSKERVVEVFSKKPAEFLNVADKYGTIAEGKPFFAALVDSVDSDFEVTVADLPGKSKNSCFVGRNLPGRISHSLFADSIFTL